MSLRSFLPLLLLAACVRAPRPGASTAAPNRFADPIQRQIATAQDERNTAALLPFLRAENPAYRAAAAEAFGSVQTPAAVPALLPLLRDAAPPVRRAAAYALGQTADSAAVDSLRVRVLQEPDGRVRRTVQEALGRCVSRRTVAELWRVEILTDTARAAALAAGLQCLAVRGLMTPEAVRRTVALLTNFPNLPNGARLAAATALARTRGLDADLARLALPTLLRLATKDRYFAVRSATAVALGRVAALPATSPATSPTPNPQSPTPKIQNQTPPAAQATAALLRLAAHDADARVRVMALRALPFQPTFYAASRAAVLAALADLRPGVALTAAEWLLAHGRGETGSDLAARASKLAAWRPRAVLLAAALRLASPASTASQIEALQKRYKAAPTAYEKGFLLQALGEAPAAFAFVRAETQTAGQAPVVAGYGLAALLTMRRNPAFATSLVPVFEESLRQALAGGDLAQVTAAAEALADTALAPHPQPAALASDLAALHTAQTRLTLPRDIEAWLALQTTLDKLGKTTRPTPAPKGTAAQHPIDWKLVETIPAGQRVRLRTTQGELVVALLVNDAPGAVGSFVALARAGFYDGLYFHRVIPNFVAQGGDPRGDGAGSAPYTLRSELPDLSYQEGSLGLASAGKDTESCQFFITHAPTPHLNGRYPIFGRVVQGLDVLPRLEIGDRILGVTVLGAGL